MYRIYFDGNEGDNDGRYDLGIPGSLSDIRPIADKLHDDLQVTLYDNEELEVEAVLEFDTKYNIWMARPLWDTLRRFDIQDAPQAGVK
jgi:hypothetical protein